jgi:hypothetical protein
LPSLSWKIDASLRIFRKPEPKFINKKIKQSHNTGFHHPPLMEESLTAPRVRMKEFVAC